MYYEKILNIETGEEILRNYTAKELEQVKLAQAEAAAEIEALTAKEAARLAVLEKLGLTADEAAALLS